MYKTTPETLDKIAAASAALIGTNPKPAEIALPMLHFRNAHPVGLAEFADFFAQNGAKKHALNKTLKAYAQVAKAAYRREQHWFGDALPDQADILFVSHFVSRNQASGGQDNYFGAVPAALQEQGQTSVIAHLNHTWCRWKDVKADWHGQTPPRVVLGRTGTVSAELGYLGTLQGAANAIGRARAMQADPFVRHLADHVVANKFHMAGSFGLRTAQQVAHLVRILKPKFLVTTFEGHVWERLAFRAARQVDPGIVCAGYHHTILFPEQKALANRIGHGFDPDIILTAGQVSGNWFHQQPAWRETPITSVGSVRSIENPARRPRETGACLVAPEGIIAEATALFGAALDGAKAAPDQQFHLRLHPVITRQAFLAAEPRFRNLPTNVSWSEGPLDQALGAAKYVFYRGSTVALSGALAGLRPIYLALPEDKFCLDPLKQAGAWRLEVTNGSTLAAALASDKAASPAERQTEFEQGATFCAQYFEPLSTQAFRKALEVDR